MKRLYIIYILLGGFLRSCEVMIINRVIFFDKKCLQRFKAVIL